MKQAAMVDGLSLDALSFFEDSPASAKVDVSGGQLIDALVIALGVVVLDEVVELSLQGTRQIVVFQQDAGLQGLMPPLRCLTAVYLQTARRDLSLGLGMVGRTADMGDLPLVQPFGQIAKDIAGAIVRQQTWLNAPDRNLRSEVPVQEYQSHHPPSS